MALFFCPHCDDLIELLGGRRANDAPQCDCGAMMEPLHLTEQLGPALDLSDPARLDTAISGMLAGERLT
jgi:hypothetical protein